MLTLQREEVTVRLRRRLCLALSEVWFDLEGGWRRLEG